LQTKHFISYFGERDVGAVVRKIMKSVMKDTVQLITTGQGYWARGSCHLHSSGVFTVS